MNFFCSASGLTSDKGSESQDNWEKNLAKTITFFVSRGHSYNDAANMTVDQLCMLCDVYSGKRLENEPKEATPEDIAFLMAMNNK